MRRQHRLQWSGAGYVQIVPTSSCLHVTGHFYSLIPSFPHHCSSPKSPTSLPFSTFVSSWIHAITSLVQSPNSLPLHPILWPPPTGNNHPSVQKGDLEGCSHHLGGFHTWTMDLMARENHCKEPGQYAPSQESVVWIPLPFVLPLCSSVLVEMVQWSSCDKLESSQDRLLT